MICPICDYPDAVPRYRMKDRTFGAAEGDFVLHHCRSCGVLFQDEAEVSSRLADFYPPGYWWKSSGKGGRLERFYREWVIRHDQLRFVQSVAPPAEGGSLLDIGCGGGTFVDAAVRGGYDAYGLEQSAEACSIARESQPDRIFEGEEGDLIADGRKYQVVTLFHALEHIPSPFRYLKTIQKLMNRPSKLIVQVPNAGSWQARLFGSRWYGLDCPRHLYNYNSYALMHLLGRAGFRVHGLRHFSLRDNAPAIVSSLFPFLDPMSQRVKRLRRDGRARSTTLLLKEAVYFPLVLLAQPAAWVEANFGRGGTLTVYATLDEPLAKVSSC